MREFQCERERAITRETESNIYRERKSRKPSSWDNFYLYTVDVDDVEDEGKL